MRSFQSCVNMRRLRRQADFDSFTVACQTLLYSCNSIISAPNLSTTVCRTRFVDGVSAVTRTANYSSRCAFRTSRLVLHDHCGRHDSLNDMKEEANWVYLSVQSGAEQGTQVPAHQEASLGRECASLSALPGSAGTRTSPTNMLTLPDTPLVADSLVKMICSFAACLSCQRRCCLV